MEDFRDDELKKWLAEEYEKEIDEMEEVLFPNGVLPDDGETEEEAKAAYKKLVDRLKADGVYEEDEPEKVKIVYFPEKKRHKAAKVAAAVLVCAAGVFAGVGCFRLHGSVWAVLVCAAGVFAASMTSQANRSYFIDSVKVWTGNDTKISVDNDPNSDDVIMDEEEGISDIEQQLEVQVPYLMYRPDGFGFKDYKVSKEYGYAIMQYNYKDVILTVYINEYSNGSKSSGESLDGQIIKSIKMQEDDTNIQIKKIAAKGDKIPSYVAYWNTDSVFYQIECKMNEQEFIKLVKNIKM